MLRDEIKSAMRDLRSDADGTVHATFVFPADFTGFKGHFPGNPVLPGVCIVQAVLAIMGAARNRIVQLDEIVSAKFTAAVSTGDALTFICREQPMDGTSSALKARVLRGEGKVAEISLKVRYVDRAPPAADGKA